MSEIPINPDGAIAAAEQELAQVKSRVATMRAVLAHLLQDVVRAESFLESNQGIQLLEANERLLLTALDAQGESESALQALDDATYEAGHDALTRLPNRALLQDRLEHAMAHAKRHGKLAALLFVDLDKFKLINDTQGHAVGDLTLQRVARYLLSAVRQSDTVSRYGGDEFLILLDEVTQPRDALKIAEKVNVSLRNASRAEQPALNLSASIGISIYPQDGETAATLIEHADTAMYVAKRQGLGRIAFHNEAQPVGANDSALTTTATPAVESQQQRLVRYEAALTQQELRHAQLREANEQLVLATLSAQNLQATAEQAQRRHAEFLARVATELNNPLSPIRIATALLSRRRADAALLPRAQAVIEQQSEQMRRVVGDLLNPALAGTVKRAEKLPLHRQLLDVTTLLEDAAHICAPALEQRLQVLALELTAERLQVSGDPLRLAQVFTHLLSNAMIYSHEGGRIRLALLAQGDWAVISVSDAGIGITAEALPTIFDLFPPGPQNSQDAHAADCNDGGHGSGLTLVRQIVEAHGGTVTAASAGRGLGSRFVVTLPLAR